MNAAPIPDPVCDTGWGRGQCVVSSGSIVESFLSDDSGNGRVLWQYDLRVSRGSVTKPVLTPTHSGTELALVGGSDGILYAFDAGGQGSNSPLWSVDTRQKTIQGFLICPTEDAIAGAPVVQVWNESNDAYKLAHGDDLIFVITDNGCGATSSNRVYAIRSSSHSVAWVLDPNAIGIPMGAGRASCTLDYSTNTLYCGTTTPVEGAFYTIWAIDTLTGDIKWADVTGSVVTQSVLGGAGQRLYVNTDAGDLYALDKMTGQVLWRDHVTAAGAHFFTDLAEFIRPDAQAVLLMVDDAGFLHARIDNGGSDSVPYPATNLGSRITTAPAVSRSNGKAFVGLSDGTLRQVDIQTGNEAPWYFTRPPQVVVAAVTGLSLDRTFKGGPPDRLVVGGAELNNGAIADILKRFACPNVLYAADLALTLQAPSQVNVGSDIAYNIVVTNAGSNWATDVNVVDQLPAAFVSATTSQGRASVYDSNYVVVRLGDMPPGGSATVQIVMNGQTSVVTNVASVNAGEFDPNYSNNIACATTTVPSPPLLNVPDDFTVEATGPAGAVVTFVVTASTVQDPQPTIWCTSRSGDTFGLGRSQVRCTATSLTGAETTKTFTITVVDTTPPVLTLPGAIRVDAIAPGGAAVNYSTSAIDVVDGAQFVHCSPPSGSMFPIGTTVAHCSASDISRNEATGAFDVTVVGVQGQIEEAIRAIGGFGLGATATRVLDNQLRTVLNAYNSGNLRMACALMTVFDRSVAEALSLKRISRTQAADLVARANQIQAVLGCR